MTAEIFLKVDFKSKAGKREIRTVTVHNTMLTWYITACKL